MASNNGKARLLLPAGVGDLYWTIVKFQAFCKRHGITDPYVSTITGPEQFKGALLRSGEFLDMVPFIKIDEQAQTFINPLPPWLRSIYLSMWHGHRTSYHDFLGFDYLLVYNSAINSGKCLEKVDDLECNWYFPLNVSDEQTLFKDQCVEKYGKYAVYLWSFCGGGYSEDFHVKQFSIDKLTESIKRFTQQTKLTPVFVGGWYDMQWPNQYLNTMIPTIPDSVNLVGQTTLDQLFGVIKGAEIVIGCHCGPMVMSGVFHKKTVMMWAKSYPHFDPMSPWVVCPPDTRDTTYRPVFTNGLTVDSFVKKLTDLYEAD